MQTNNFKIVLQTLGICVLFTSFPFKKGFSQNNDCSCPMFKDKILIDNSYETMGGKLIPRAEIKSKRTTVYSASSGAVASVVTLHTGRIYIRIASLGYTYMYENIFSSECFVGQNIHRGQQLGRLKEGEHLYISILDGKKLVHPETLLPCRKIKVNK